MKETRFKQTEIGSIPEDWEVTTIDNVSHFLKKIVYPDLTPKVLYKEYSMPSFDLNMKPAVIKGEDMSSSRILMIGDNVLLINKLNVRKKRIWYVETPASNSVCSGEFIPISSDIEILKFIKYYLQQESVVNEWVENSTGTSNSQKRVNPSFIKKYIIAFPQSSERERIVRTLTTTDKFIDTINSLIEKKKLIKQGAMQELLTGKKRLPGFTGEWVERRLGDIGFTYTGLSGKNKDDFQRGNARYIPFLNVLNNPIIDTKDLEKVKINIGENQNKVLKGDLLFNTSSETPEEVGICSLLNTDIDNLYLNSFCFGFRIFSQNINGLYLSYYFRSKYGRDLMIKLAQGATRYNLPKAQFLLSSIKLPKTYAEQKAISEVILSIDKEIESLEGKKAKYEQIKQGMMQQLLTGKIRLIS